MITMRNAVGARVIGGVLLAVTLLTCVGCENGARRCQWRWRRCVSGLAIGSLTGSAGKGAAIGAIVGGVGGAVVGDQNKRNREAAEAASSQPPPTVVVTQQQPYVTGQALGRLVGQWKITGTINSGTANPLPVDGNATGTIDKTYFVRLDLNFTDPRTGQPVQGTSTISQTGGRGVEMANSFSTSPRVNQFKGNLDASGSIFELKQFDPPNSSRRVIIRLSSSNQWTADVWDGANRVESYTFTRIAS